MKREGGKAGGSQRCPPAPQPGVRKTPRSTSLEETGAPLSEGAGRETGKWGTR